MLYVRAAIVWCGIAVLAIANGAIRVALIVPLAGERVAHVVSTLALSAVVAAVAWLAIRWIGPTSARDAMRVGAIWAALTVAFEFGAGHFIFGAPWAQLFADYNVLAGRIWPLVLAVTAVSPSITARGRRLVGATDRVPPEHVPRAG